MTDQWTSSQKSPVERTILYRTVPSIQSDAILWRRSSKALLAATTTVLFSRFYRLCPAIIDDHIASTYLKCYQCPRIRIFVGGIVIYYNRVMDSCKPDEKRPIIIKFNVCLVEELKYFFIIGNIIDIRKLNCIRGYELHLFTEIKIYVKIFILIFLYKN